MKNLPLILILCLSLFAPLIRAQENAPAETSQPAAAPAPLPPSADKPAPNPEPTLGPTPDKASVTSSITPDGSGKIVVEAHGEFPKPPVFYSSEIVSTATVSAERIDYLTTIKAHLLQGEAATLSYWTHGLAEITEVSGKSLDSWAVRWQDKKRYLDIRLKPDQKPGSDVEFTVKMRSEKLTLPTTQQITNFGPGEGATTLNQVLTLSFAKEIAARVTAARSFLPVDAADQREPNRFQSSTGGQLTLHIDRSGTLPAAIEMNQVRLSGKVDGDARSADFQLTGSAVVTEPGAEITILQGNAAISELPLSADFELRLDTEGKAAVYRLKFPKAGEFPIDLQFVAGLTQSAEGVTTLDFTVASGAVVPLTLSGFSDSIEFVHQADSVAPARRDEDSSWMGYVPASGRTHLVWKSARRVGEGRLFFSTSGRVEATVGAGLLRQQHFIDYKVLQGELSELSLGIDGAGEILAVEGQHIVGWSIAGPDDARTLEIKLSQPIPDSAQLQIRTQTALDALPVKLQAMRLTPQGAVRHSGHLRIVNQGSVRLEPSNPEGLTQLSPEQFPGDAIQARQVFVYRFPATDYSLTITADRIQPEVSVSELSIYRLSKTDRTISSDIELDIREAPIREWNIGVPADYSVVKVLGAAVADYVPGSEVVDGRRTVKVLFAEEVSGRQLVSLHLEKSDAAAAGDWLLPRLTFAAAKSLRGDIGVAAEPGFRISAGANELLVEKPLSTFPKAAPGLQQAFRIREAEWSATMQIELLEKSVQADVFHLHSLSERSARGSVLINYLVTGAPVSEWQISVPEDVINVGVEGRDVRTWRHDGETLTVSLQQPVIGLYQLLVTFEEDLASAGASQFQPGRVAPVDVQSERGYLQVVSPLQVELKALTESPGLLKIDALELPAELRLIASAPPLASWQYTERPFQLDLQVNWFEPGTTLQQVIDFSEVTTRITADGELVSEALYFVRSRGQRALRLHLDASERLWSVSVDGKTINARSESSETKTILIPLPGTADPNRPLEVRLRVGRSAGTGSQVKLSLPVADVPTLKTDWRILGDEKQALIATRGSVAVPTTAEPISGFAWLSAHGLVALTLALVLVVIGVYLSTGSPGRSAMAASSAANISAFRQALACLLIVTASLVVFNASAQTYARSSDELPANALRLSVPALSGGEAVTLDVDIISRWQLGVSWFGILVALAGLILVVTTLLRQSMAGRRLARLGGLALLILGVLAQGNSGPPALKVLGVALLLFLALPRCYRLLKRFRDAWKQRRESAKVVQSEGSGSDGNNAPAPTPTALWLVAGLLAYALVGNGATTAPAQGLPPADFSSADSITQKWQIDHDEKSLVGRATMQLRGKSGDRFIVLASPAVLTKFEGKGLRIDKQTVTGFGLAYVATVESGAVSTNPIRASFDYQLSVGDLGKGIAVPTGPAALQKLTVSIDQGAWEILSPSAVKLTELKSDAERSSAEILLAAGVKAQIAARPKPRDLSRETTQFYVEGTQLYVPGPGVVDGLHVLQVRPSQGQVSALQLTVPEGLTVSEVTGPIGSWQFDAEQRNLQLAIEPPQSQAFAVRIATQRGLDPLPADAKLEPLQVKGAAAEVGLVALAFGADAQPEKAESAELSEINASDFDASLLEGKQAVLHRVFRYGADGGGIELKVAAVAPEVRVVSKQVLSFGDERVLLSVNFSAEITRSGLFQLSFLLPDGLEVESLTGAALHHWAETANDDGQREIVLHLNGKTIGVQTFSLALAGVAPGATDEWPVPRFVIREAERQSGDLVIQSTTGIRLQPVNRQNVSEVDPRSLGGNTQGALAFRLLQKDWTLTVGVEQLDARISAQVLHEVSLREGQTRTALIADLNVSNASIRGLQLRLPISDEDEIRTVRASGNAVSDLVRSAADSDIWELQFKRRIVGNEQIRIEFDRRDRRESATETLTPITFPAARVESYHFAVRAGGRLDLNVGELPRGWQDGDWTTVPASLREAANRTAPNVTLRAISPDSALNISVQRHSLAKALKLRISEGILTTVLSPHGDQVTAVDLTADVIQPGSLAVTLPEDGQLFSIFVNNESVHSIREGGEWKFHVLPGIDEKTASVRFVYSVPGDGLRKTDLRSPPMNVPLENIAWHVIAPEGFELSDNDGDLQLRSQNQWQRFDRSSYLAKEGRQRDLQAQHAANLLERAGKFRQSGDQGKALWALNSVVNQHALDAATNEDALVQLENLQTQQTVVGLNTRRQRLYLDNAGEDGAVPSEQLIQGAAANPVLQNGELNFRPQDFSQLLQGNSSEDNEILRRIAVRMVEQQRSSESAPQAISVTLPDEGKVYTFVRSVQVSEDAPLELDLRFAATGQVGFWRSMALLILLCGIVLLFLHALPRVRAA